MKDLLAQLDNLPDETLMYIFKKLYNDEVLYSLMDVNQRINRIIHDTTFTRTLCLLKYYSYDDSTFPLSDAILDRFCSTVLPEIGHQIETLFLEGTSIERILHATNYPSLNNLGLCDINSKLALSLFDDNNPFTHIYKNQISSLFINFNDENNSFPIEDTYSIIFRRILTIFTNLRCLKFNPSSSFDDALFLHISRETVISSTLLELHVSVSNMHDCLYILDGRFDQLRILYVTFYSVPPTFSDIRHKQEQLPNLRIFSLCCKEKINDFDKSIVPLLHRMPNLEELDLNIKVQYYKDFLDGYTLYNDIIIRMRQLYKFTFSTCSIINHCNQTIFPLNEHIQKIFEYFFNNQIITCIDHFQEKRYSQCHIYSYPYNWKVYKNITNQFRGGLFTSVTTVSLYDECPFENEFFLRIAQSFPFMKELKIKNRKAQNNRQLIKSNNDNQILSIIKYPNLIRLDLTDAHDNYVELFLFDTKMCLPYNLHLCINYQSLASVTHYFTRYNCRKLAALYCYPEHPINERIIKTYFPHTYIRPNHDFVLSK